MKQKSAVRKKKEEKNLIKHTVGLAENCKYENIILKKNQDSTNTQHKRGLTGFMFSRYAQNKTENKLNPCRP